MKLRISVLVLLGCAASAAERHPWAGFLPGSYARWKTVTRSGVNESTAEVKQTVISVSLNHAVLETETLFNGRLVRRRTYVPLRAEPAAIPVGKIVTLAKETVIVESKAVSAVCYESSSEARQGRMSESAQAAQARLQTSEELARWPGRSESVVREILRRSCLSGEVPGGIVRSMTRLEGVESSTELVAFGVH